MYRRDFIGLIAVSALALGPTMASATDFQLEGNWLGVFARGQEQAPFGIRFELSNKVGGLVARLWNMPLHIYGLPASRVTRVDRKVELPGLELELQFEDVNTLRGVMGNKSTDVTLHRVKAMPDPLPPELNAALAPPPLWTATTGPVWAAPLYAQGHVFICSNDGCLTALDAASGRRTWQYVADGALFGSPAIADEHLLLFTDAGTLICLDSGTGKERWHHRLGRHLRRVLPGPDSSAWDYAGASPMIKDGVVFIGTAQGALHAIRLRDGRSKWTSDAHASMRTSVSVTGDIVAFGTMEGSVVALHRSDGSQVWSVDLGGAVVKAPVAWHESIIVGTRKSSRLLALQANSGQVIWERYYWESWVESAPSISDGMAYVGSSDLRTVQAFNPETGKMKWQRDVLGWSWGTPAVAGDTIFAGTAGGGPYYEQMVGSACALRASDGSWKWRSAPISAPKGGFVGGFAGGPALTDQQSVIFASTLGRVTAYPLD